MTRFDHHSRKNHAFLRRWRRVCVTVRWINRRLPFSAWYHSLIHEYTPAHQRLVAFIQKHDLWFYLSDRLHSWERGIRNQRSVFDHRLPR